MLLPHLVYKLLNMSKKKQYGMNPDIEPVSQATPVSATGDYNNDTELGVPVEQISAIQDFPPSIIPVNGTQSADFHKQEKTAVACAPAVHPKNAKNSVRRHPRLYSRI